MSTSANRKSFSELTVLAQFGDQEAMTELYNRTYSAVYHTTKALIRDEDTAQDILQDAYIKGFQNLNRLREPEQFQAWMKMIAVNTAKNVLKRKKPILFTEMENEDGEMETEFVDDRVENLPEVVMDRKETSRLVSEILDTLPDDQRLVIGMFYYEEMSVQQIAATLGISENTVKSRLNYGRKKVEVKVRDLEKRGTKLYSLAPLPFLVMLLGMEASAEAVPSAATLQAITAECASTAFIAAETAGTASQGGRLAAQGAVKTGTKGAVKAGANAAGKTAAKAAAKALGTKIAAGVLAASMVGGGAAFAMNKIGKADPKEYQKFVGTYVNDLGCTVEVMWTEKALSTLETHSCGGLMPDGMLLTYERYELKDNTVYTKTSHAAAMQLDEDVLTLAYPPAWLDVCHNHFHRTDARFPSAPAEAMPADTALSVSINEASHTAYQQVLESYAQVLSVDSDVFLSESFDHPEKYFNGDHVAVRYYHMFRNDPYGHSFWHAYYDINHDGTDELLIGISSDGSQFSVVDVYGFDGTSAIELMDEIALGDRASLTLYQDGNMFLYGSNGASAAPTEEWYAIAGSSLVPGTPGNAPEVTDISWQKLDVNPAQASTETENNPFETGDWVTAYEAALRDYRGVWAITWDNPALIGKERETYPNARGSDTTLNHTTEKMVYALKDLDGNGNPELLIGVDYHGNGEISLYDAFAANGTAPVHLVGEGHGFTILNDGAIVKADNWFGTILDVMRISRDGYFTEIIPGDPLRGANLFEDSTDFSAHGGKLTGLDWHPLEEPFTHSAAPAELSFDSLRADIRAACTVTDYDSRPDYYNDLYRHLGKGPTWALCNREVPKDLGIGSLYYNVFCVEFDIDGDGETELCISKGITVQRAQMIVIYDRTENGITPIFGDEVFTYLGAYENNELPVSLTQWESMT